MSKIAEFKEMIQITPDNQEFRFWKKHYIVLRLGPKITTKRNTAWSFRSKMLYEIMFRVSKRLIVER